MSVYAYCLSDDVTGGAIEGAVGIAGAKPYLLDFGWVKAVVSESGRDAVSVTRENVVAHEQVIGYVLARTTPLPFRFGTVAAPSRLGSYIESEREHLCGLLARVRGAVEMNVKVMWGAGGGPGGAAARERGDEPEAAGPGHAFLLAKRREMEEGRVAKEGAERIAAWLEGGLRDVAREAAISVMPAGALVVSAAFLVDRARIPEYQERLKLMRGSRNDLRFLTSGAWPPYSFANLRS